MYSILLTFRAFSRSIFAVFCCWRNNFIASLDAFAFCRSVSSWKNMSKKRIQGPRKIQMIRRNAQCKRNRHGISRATKPAPKNMSVVKNEIMLSFQFRTYQIENKGYERCAPSTLEILMLFTHISDVSNPIAISTKTLLIR